MVYSFSSLYYYYDTETELLKAGPVWDFDISLSAVGTNTDYSSYRRATLWACYANDDYNALFKFKKDKIKAKYKVVRSVLASALDELEIVKPYLEDAQERNLEKWSLPGDLSTWISARYEQEYQNIKTIEGHYEYIKTKLEAQLGYMDQEYL